MHVIPTDTLYLTIDKEAVRKSGMMMASDSIPDQMIISLKGKNALYKGDLMMLEMIHNATGHVLSTWLSLLVRKLYEPWRQLHTGRSG